EKQVKADMDVNQEQAEEGAMGAGSSKRKASIDPAAGVRKRPAAMPEEQQAKGQAALSGAGAETAGGKTADDECSGPRPSRAAMRAALGLPAAPAAALLEGAAVLPLQGALVTPPSASLSSSATAVAATGGIDGDAEAAAPEAAAVAVPSGAADEGGDVAENRRQEQGEAADQGSDAASAMEGTLEGALEKLLDAAVPDNPDGAPAEDVPLGARASTAFACSQPQQPPLSPPACEPPAQPQLEPPQPSTSPSPPPPQSQQPAASESKDLDASRDLAAGATAVKDLAEFDFTELGAVSDDADEDPVSPGAGGVGGT
ncbi:unnamed protein product, partial [Prorocentrum cordatum]